MIAVEVIGAIATIFSAGIAVGKHLAEHNKNDRHEILKRFAVVFDLIIFKGFNNCYILL